MSADGAHYMELARQSWHEGAAAGMDWYSGPGYPVPVGWVYGLFGNLDFAGRLVSFLFGLGSIVGVWMLGRRLFGRSVAIVAASLLAVHTTFVRHAVMAETDTAYGFWLIWSLVCGWETCVARGTRSRLAWSLGTGTCLGLGFLTRPEAVPLAGLVGLWFLAACRTVSFPKRVATVLFATTIFGALSSPYLWDLRQELGRWSLSGKERSIVLKFVPDKRNYERVLRLGITGAVLKQPGNLIHWLPYHLHWGIPQMVKSLHPVMLPFVLLGGWAAMRRRSGSRSVRYLLWVTVPFLLFFFLTFPGRRYFMQAMPPLCVLAGAGIVAMGIRIARVRRRIRWDWGFGGGRTAAWRAFRLSALAPVAVMAVVTWLSNQEPIEESLRTERILGERILADGGPGRRILSFTVTAFHADGTRVPLWGPMEGIVRCHGYGKPKTYEELVGYVREHGVEYLVMDHDLRKDCPEFDERVSGDEFRLVVGDISDHHGPCRVYRYLGGKSSLRAN